MGPIASLRAQLRALTREYKRAVKVYGGKVHLSSSWSKEIDQARGVVDDLKDRMDFVSGQINDHDWSKDT